VRALVGAALLHGLAVAMALSLILLVAERTGSYANAGVAGATYIVVNGLFAPVWGRLTDRIGPTRVLVPLAFAGAAAFWLLVIVALADAPLGALAAAAGLAGSCQAPVTSTLRSLWARVVPADDLGQAANALQSTLYEVIGIAGPLLGGAVATVASPQAALAITGSVLLVSDLLFATRPATRAWQPEPAGDRHRLGPLRFRGLRTLVACSLPAGAAIGVVEVASPAFADEHGAGAAGAIPLAALAAGSMIGALVYGARSWTASAVARYAWLCVALAGGLAVAAVAQTVATLAALLFVAGLVVGPITTTIFVLLDDVVPREAATEGLTWVITAFTAGIAAGSVVGGALHESAGTEVVFLTAGGLALVELAVLAARRATLRVGAVT
jgi:MFS family permease